MKLNCVGITKDNQDGGYSIKIYNNVDELVADHWKVQEGEITRDELLDEYDPYENGYIDLNVVIELSDDGRKLLSPICLYVGE